MYGEALEQDLLFRRDLEEAFATQDFDGCRVLLDSWKPKALSRKKDDSVQEDKRELAKNLRDQAKDAVKKLRENYFYETTEEVLEELELCREPVQELIRLTRQFIETFSEKKRQKNIVDLQIWNTSRWKSWSKKKTGRSGIPRQRMNFPIVLRKF